MNILRSLRAASGRPNTESTTELTKSEAPVFTMRMRRDNLIARAREVDGEFVVLAGSHARLEWSGVDHTYKRLRNDLEAKGTIGLTADERSSVFKEDQVFSSPSAAAAAVAGRNANGRIEWRVEGSDLTYAQWQDSKLDNTSESVQRDPKVLTEVEVMGSDPCPVSITLEL